MLTDRFAIPNADYLIPPLDVHQINHEAHYIHHGSEKKAIRKIFYTIEFTQYEKHGIEELRLALNHHPDMIIPEEWTDVDLLKYCYAGKFSIKKILGLLKKHFEWRNNEAMHSLSSISESYLKEGVVYQYGRDRLYRPIVIINIGKINFKKLSADELISALSCCLTLTKRSCFVQGKVEQWIIVIDINNMGIAKLPFKVLGKIIESMQINFTCTLEKLFILNPSFSLHTSWKIIEAMIDVDTAAKIRFLKKGHYNEIFQLVDQNQVEEKYGGNIKELTEFWPPINTIPKERYIRKNNSTILNDTKSNLFPIPENDGPVSTNSVKVNDYVKQDTSTQENIIKEAETDQIKREVEKPEIITREEKLENKLVREDPEPVKNETPVRILRQASTDSPENKQIENFVNQEPRNNDNVEIKELPGRKEIIFEGEETKTRATGACSCGSSTCNIF